MILDGLNTFHGRGNIAEILPGWPTVRGILSWAVKMDELHAADHIYIHNYVVFSVRLNSQRYEILEAQDCTDPTAPLDLQWKVSFPACCLSYASDKHWPLRNVHFVNTDLWDTVHLLADDDLKKIVAAKIIGMPLPVDCWRAGIWWWDSWCSSRCHCYGWVCRYWCQCCELSVLWSRTAIMWMQYKDRIDILKWFIMFEWTGNWVMHFQAMKEMLR